MDPMAEMEEAFIKEDKKAMKEIIEKNGIDMFCRVKFNNHSLYHWFVIEGDLDFVIFLLDKGWNVDQKDREGDNALHYAAAKDNVPMIKYLIERGISMDEKGIRGITPFLDAIKYGGFQGAKTLYEYGANPNEKFRDGSMIFKHFSDTTWKLWIPILLAEPERLQEENLKLVKAKRIEILYT